MNLETIPAGYLPLAHWSRRRQRTTWITRTVAPATATRGAANINNTLDFGFDPYSDLDDGSCDFMASYIAENRVQVEWTATDETGTAAYNLYRSLNANGTEMVKVNIDQSGYSLETRITYSLTRVLPTRPATTGWPKLVIPDNNQVMMDEVRCS